MQYSYAKNAAPEDTSWQNVPAVNMAFSGVTAPFTSLSNGADQGTTANDTARFQDSTETTDAAEEIDTLVLNPYVQTLKQQILERIDGAHPGEALEFITNALDGESLAVIYDTLAELSYEFEDRGLDYLWASINEELSLLAAQYGNTTEAAHARLMDALSFNQNRDYDARVQKPLLAVGTLLPNRQEDFDAMQNTTMDCGIYSRISPLMTAIREELEMHQRQTVQFNPEAIKADKLAQHYDREPKIPTLTYDMPMAA